MEGDADFGWLIGATITRIELICLASPVTVLGYLLYFDNGNQIWSTPGTEGNWIRRKFSNDRMQNWQLIKVALDETTMQRID